MMNFLVGDTRSALPLTIREAEYSDPVLHLKGDGWSLSVMTVRRVIGSSGLLFSCDSKDATDRVWDLIGDTITSIQPLGATVHVDPIFVLDSGHALEVMSLDGIEPWVLRIGDMTWVASPADINAFDPHGNRDLG